MQITLISQGHVTTDIITQYINKSRVITDTSKQYTNQSGSYYNWYQYTVQ